MFGLFRKRESAEEFSDRIHAETIDTFRDIGAIRTLAHLHNMAMTEEVTPEEQNDLVMGAYRTLYLGVGLARYRSLREGQDSVQSDKIANSILSSSALLNIVTLIRESVSRTETEPLFAVGREVGSLFEAASMLDRLARKHEYARAHEVWRVCAKGSYAELPLVFVSAR